jgi:hypothetical protein
MTDTQHNASGRFRFAASGGLIKRSTHMPAPMTLPQLLQHSVPPPHHSAADSAKMASDSAAATV